MKESYKIADAERDVMEVLWQYSEAVSTKELLDIMNKNGKNWKRQTLKEPAPPEVELLQKQTEEFLDNCYGGKLSNFCAALTGKTAISQEEADRLEALIGELRSKS